MTSPTPSGDASHRSTCGGNAPLRRRSIAGSTSGQLLPGIPLQWGQRSLADQERHLAAAKKGGEATGGPIREQQRVFWRWYYGDCKEQLQGPFRTVVETLERIEAAYAQRYGWKGRMSLRWDGFMHYVFSSYVLVGCRKMRPETIERDMWRRYQALMDANDKALYGEGSSPGLLSPYLEFEAEKSRQEAWADARREMAVSGNKASRKGNKK
jgi:hypothetical protein